MRRWSGASSSPALRYSPQLGASESLVTVQRVAAFAASQRRGRKSVRQPDSSRGRDSMMTYYPIVLDVETSGAVSAYVPGLPVYAAADTRAKAEQAIRSTLAAYLAAHPDTVP